MTRRADESEKRPEAISVLRNSVDLKKKVIKAWPDSKPWINETEAEKASAAVSCTGLRRACCWCSCWSCWPFLMPS
jgi:hypothetical protein